MSDKQVKERLDSAVEFAWKAGDRTLEHFRTSNLAIERKGDDSPVTVADKQAELLLRELILDRFPDDSVVGEEFDDVEGSSPFCWVLDPIDGTKSFIHGIPLYTTLIGVLQREGDSPQRGEPAIGVIHAPALAEMVWAATGHGALYQRGDSEPVAARVSDAPTLAESLLVTSEVAHFGRRSTNATNTFLALQDATRLVRTWGDGYGYMMVATGRAEVAIDPNVNLWDIAALLPVIREAGGHFSDWNSVPTVHSDDCFATNGKVTDEVLAIIGK